MLRRSPMKPGASTLKRTGFKTPATSSGILRIAAVERERKTKAKKSRGMKGRAPTAAEKRFMDQVAALGCIACSADGYENFDVSIHHVHGRTAVGCHFQVLPLCGPHHQDDGTALAVHPWKTRWEARYGKQDDLVAVITKKIGFEHAS